MTDTKAKHNANFQVARTSKNNQIIYQSKKKKRTPKNPKQHLPRYLKGGVKTQHQRPKIPTNQTFPNTQNVKKMMVITGKNKRNKKRKITSTHLPTVNIKF